MSVSTVTPTESTAHRTPALALRRVRKRRGLTQQQLADAVGRCRDTIGQLERGCKVPRWPTVCALARALDATPWDIFPPEDGNGPEPIRAVATVQAVETGRHGTG